MGWWGASRDLEELMAERGLRVAATIDTPFRGGQPFRAGDVDTPVSLLTVASRTSLAAI